MFDLIPLEIDAKKFGALPIFSDGLLLLEDASQVVNMEITNILYTKVVDDEEEEDGAPCVAPKARGGGGVVVTHSIEACFKEIVGKNASLG